MSKHQIAALFKDKMTSFEQYLAAAGQAWAILGHSGTANTRSLLGELLDTYGGPLVRHLPETWWKDERVAFTQDRTVTAVNWWWHREQIRQIVGVYPHPTETMANLIETLRLQAYAVHMSNHPDTPDAVCYTPDAAMGLADRQVKLSSLGKLVSKLFPLGSDTFKQKVEAEHRGELDPTIHMATTKEDILRVYRGVEGDSGCMRYDGSHWDLPVGYHPSNVYAAAGVGVAYHEVDGVLKARALTWEDPATGRKQFVRLYGDRVLRRKLERAGYEYGSMAGAKIKAVKMPEDRYGPNKYLVPYIDGGRGNADHEGTWGYIDARDPEHIQLVSEDRRRTLVRAGIDVCSFRDHRNVVHYLEPQDLSSLMFTCPLTGVSVDRTVDPVREVWWMDQKTYVLSTEDARRRFPVLLKRIMPDGSWGTLWHTDNTPRFFSSGHGWTLDTAVHRETLGWRRLSTKYYHAGEWAPSATWLSTADGHAIYKSDAVQVIHADGASEFMHLSDVASQIKRKGDYFSIGTINKMPHYAHKDHPGMRLLRSGKRAVLGYNDIVELFDGTWTQSRNAEKRKFYGESVYWLKNEPMPVDASMAERALRNVLQSAFDVKAFCEMALLRCSMDASQATDFVRNYLFQRLTDGRLNQAAGHVPGFYNDGSFYGMTSSNWFNSVDLARVYLGQCERIDTSELGSVAVGHLALLIAVLREVISLHENAPTLVAHALTRMTEEAEQLAEAA
jgi:hypothetical protein